jgi:uncharacterized membrane protein YfcA
VIELHSSAQACRAAMIPMFDSGVTSTASPVRWSAQLGGKALLLVLIIGLIAGYLIGLVGVGGVIVVPGMVLLAGMQTQDAVAVAMAGFMATGIFGASLYAYEGASFRSEEFFLLGSSLVGAMCGAFAIATLPNAIASLVVSLIILGACGMAVLGGQAAAPCKVLGTRGYSLVGFVVGFGSALSGTGGPLLLAPLLLWRRVEPRRVVSVSRAIQLPIAGSATATSFIVGNIPWQQACVVSVGLLLGMAIAVAVAPRLSGRLLRTVILLIVMAAALGLLIKAIGIG